MGLLPNPNPQILSTPAHSLYMYYVRAIETTSVGMPPRSRGSPAHLPRPATWLGLGLGVRVKFRVRG